MPLLSTLDRLYKRLGNALICHCHFPPSWLGYSALRPISVNDYCRGANGHVTTLRDSRVVPCPLPVNYSNRNDLSKCAGRYERSFFDVPEYRLDPTYVAAIKNAKILRSRDQWGDDFYAIVTANDRVLQTSGTGYLQAHRPCLKPDSRSIERDTVAWITTHSTRNHYMWLFSHLTRLMVAEELKLTANVLYPAEDLLAPAKRDMLSLLGIQNPTFIPKDVDCIRVKNLFVIETDAFDPVNLLSLRSRLATAASQKDSKARKIYISRAKCHYRKCANESELVPWLVSNGFTIVCLEDHSIQEQIDLMQNAEVVLGVHGAGFANILFCKPGTQIIEIQDREDPNPHFYAIAALTGLDYRLIYGQPMDGEAHFRDLRIANQDLAAVLQR